MNIEKELRDALVAMEAVTAIVSTRIWDEWFRTETTPSIVFEFDTEDQENDLGGKGGKVIGDINVICRADTRAASRDLAEAVRLNGTDPGTGLAGYTSSTVNATLLGQQPVATPKSEGSNDHWYDTNMNFELQWWEGR